MKRLSSFSALVFLVLFVCPLLAVSQGIQQTPYSPADTVRRRAQSTTLDLAPSNPLGMPRSSMLGPRGSDNISISSGMFQGIMPQIPNLQLGYNYTFGSQLRAGSASVDYLLPFKIDADTTVYGEAHGEFQTLSITQPGSPNNCTELNFGGGYRRMLGKDTMVGVHSFFNTAKLSGTWYPSASAGVEFASMISGHDAIDFIFNWYGKALDATIFAGTPAYATAAATANFGNANFDFQVGFSHELYNGGPDLRLSATGYKLECGSKVYGYYAGAELKSRDGVCVVKYDVGYDNAFDVYQSVAAFVNMGLQLENLLEGKSPLVKPKPIFQSPRNMTTLTQAKPSRNWKHTSQAATSAIANARAQNCNCGLQTITVVNNLSSSITLYMGFNIDDYGNIQSGGYALPGSFPGWTLVPPPVPNARPVLSTTLNANSPLVINFPCTQTDSLGHGAHFALSVNQVPWNGCIWGAPQTLAEFGLCDNWGSQYSTPMDSYDISLVNGFDNPMEITTTGTGGSAKAPAATGNSNTPGVYGYGWTGCSVATPPLACTPTLGENHPTNIDCNLHQTNGSNYTVYIGGALP